MSNYLPQATTDQNFSADVLTADKPILVDFWAQWCGPCRAIAPVLDNLAEEYRDQIAIKKLDADANPESIATYGVRSIPTLVLFKDGEAQEVLTGLQSKKAIEAVINRYTTNV